MTLEYGNDPNTEIQRGSVAANGGASQNHTGEVLLADASGKIPGTISDDPCAQPGPSTSSSFTPSVWDAGKDALEGAALGVPVGAAWGPASRIWSSTDRRANRTTVTDMTPDLLARRDRYISYVDEELQNFSLERRITLARTAGNPLYAAENDGLLNRFAPANNLDAMDARVAQFLGSTRDQILDESHVLLSFLTPAQVTEIGALRDTLNTAQQNENRAAEAQRFLNLSDDQILEVSRPLPSFLTRAQVTEIGGIRDALNTAQQNESRAGEAQRFLNLTDDQILEVSRPLPSFLTEDQRDAVRVMREDRLTQRQNERLAGEAQDFEHATTDQILSTRFRLPSFLTPEQREAVDQMRRDRNTLQAQEAEQTRLGNRLRRETNDQRRAELEDDLHTSTELADNARTELDTAEQNLRSQVREEGEHLTTNAENARLNVQNGLHDLKTVVATKQDEFTQGAKTGRSEASRRMQQLKTKIATTQGRFADGAETERRDVVHRIQQLKTDVTTDYKKFASLRGQIRNVDQAEFARLANLRRQLVQNRDTNPTSADDALARLLSTAPEKDGTGTPITITDRAGKTVSLRIGPDELKTFSTAYARTGADQLPKSRAQIFSEIPEEAGSAWTRAKLGGGVGAFLGATTYGLYAAYETVFGSSGSSKAEAASQCEADHADEILNQGSQVPSTVTGTGHPDIILNDKDANKTYDFGSQALSALRNAEIDARSDNITLRERTAVFKKANEQRASILEQKHDMKAIENELSTNPYMLDPEKRIGIATELNNSLQKAENYDGQQGIAKAYRDIAVWNMAYIDAVNNKRITGVASDELTTLGKQVKNALRNATLNDRSNPDLQQLEELAHSPEISPYVQ